MLGEGGEAFLGHIEVAEGNTGLGWGVHLGQQRGKQCQRGTVEGRNRYMPLGFTPELCDRLLCPFKCHLHIHSCRGQGAAGIRQCGPSSVFEGQRGSRAALQGGELLGNG